MFYQDGFNPGITVSSPDAPSTHDPVIADVDTAGKLAHAAWVKVPKFEEIVLATVEVNASMESDPQVDQCLETILAWRQMIGTTTNSSRQSADAYVSQTCRPLSGQFMELASCATDGKPFEFSREGDYAAAWIEFEHFCVDPHSVPTTAWGRKYRKTQHIEFQRQSQYARQEPEAAFNRWALRHTMIVESPLP
ncbi:hypothetical protein [Caballeronia cordobensis]|uniref:hypothetical protein n=1 Tax=Caballeronia cordobensis TaxID=1353886 RepID=UPI00128EF280|nr:hypothetical protein [Caballeronia cordobensis]